jgi:hypothetical protein
MEVGRWKWEAGITLEVVPKKNLITQFFKIKKRLHNK